MKPWIKISLAILFLIAVLSYFTFSFLLASEAESREVCVQENIHIHLSDNSEQLLTESEISHIIYKAGFNGIGLPLSKVNTLKIESILKNHTLIKQAFVFKTTDGHIHIDIWQRTPILRVMANGSNYYVCSQGQVIQAPLPKVLSLPIVTGYCDKKMACTDIHKIALYLQKEEFWNSQIEQIYVREDSLIEFIPRVGDQIILLGKLTSDFENKLEDLKILYKEGFNKIGWNKYNNINLMYKDQIICTKEEETCRK